MCLIFTWSTAKLEQAVWDATLLRVYGVDHNCSAGFKIIMWFGYTGLSGGSFTKQMRPMALNLKGLCNLMILLSYKVYFWILHITENVRDLFHHIPKDFDNNAYQYIECTMMNFGNGPNNIYPGTCGSALWTMNNEAAALFRWYAEKVAIAYAPAMNILINSGYKIEAIS